MQNAPKRTHGSFHKWGYPQFSSIYRWDFPNKNHPVKAWHCGAHTAPANRGSSHHRHLTWLWRSWLSHVEIILIGEPLETETTSWVWDVHKVGHVPAVPTVHAKHQPHPVDHSMNAHKPSPTITSSYLWFDENWWQLDRSQIRNLGRWPTTPAGRRVPAGLDGHEGWMFQKASMEQPIGCISHYIPMISPLMVSLPQSHPVW